jgi:hypothetical protein
MPEPKRIRRTKAERVYSTAVIVLYNAVYKNKKYGHAESADEYIE